MIIPLVRRNLRHQRWLLLGLVIGVIAWALLLIRIGAEFTTGSQIEELLNLLPPFIRNIVGSQLGAASFPAFVAFTFQHPAMLGISLAFIVVAGTIPAGERDAGMLDLLLARPLPRVHYLASVVITIIADAAMLSLSVVVGIIIGLGMVDAPDELPWTRYIGAAASFFMLNIAIAGCALVAAVASPRRGTAVAWIVAVVFTLYVIEMLADLWSPLASIRWISPFHYFKPVRSTIAGEIPTGSYLVLLVVFAVSTAGAFVSFQRREM